MLGVMLGGPAEAQQTPTTQCLVTALAGGTADVITVPRLPCVPTATTLLLTMSGTNTTTTPTIQPVGGPIQTVKNSDGTNIAIGGMLNGATYLFSNNGTNWLKLTSPSSGTGTVTSVTFTGDGTVLSSTPSSAVTQSGTLLASLNTQVAHAVLVGPTSGAAANPTFRAITCSDVSGSGPGCSNTTSVSSVGLSVPAASVFGVTGSPVTASGTLGLTTTGTSGGVAYFSSTSAISSSGLLTANAPVLGGGVGASPVSGARSGNTTTFATTSGVLTSGNAAKFDASGNLVDGGAPPGKQRLAIGWPSGIDPNNNIIATVDEASTVASIVGTVSAAVGSAATVSIYKAGSGTACSSGTVLHSGSFDANGTANTNQTLTVTTTALSAGDRLCLVTTGGANWTGGSGIGGVTVRINTP